MGMWIVRAGLWLVVVGIVILLGERLGLHAGRLPGDIRIAGRNGAFYFPVVTCILISLALSLAAWLFRS